MGFTKLFSSVSIFCTSRNFGRASVRLCSGVQGCVDNLKKSDKIEKKTEEQGGSSGNKSGLVLGLYETDGKFELTAATEEINQKSGGKISRYLNEISCQLKLGKAFVVTDVVPEFGPVALSSLGKKEPGYNKLEELDETRENVRTMVGAGVRALADRGCEHVEVDAASAPDAAAEAAHLAAWRFEEFKSNVDRSPNCRVSLHGEAGLQEWESGSVLGRAQNWARFLSDMPANKMTPIDFAQAALDVLCPLGVQVTAHERTWIEAQRMEAFLAVAHGSCEPPVFLECIYRAGGDRPTVLIAGKGITFDSGGMCLRRAKDWSCREEGETGAGGAEGAAAVVGTLRALAELKVPVNVCAVVPLFENMISGQCVKVGDVLRALNGLSMQVQHTGAAGRLALADALVYGQAQYRPALVIDVVSITGGVLSSTGGAAFGCFTNSQNAWGAIKRAGATTGDRPWRFPLWNYYQKQIDSEPAFDLRNRGSGTATSCVGAAFLKNFICGEWVHMEVCGAGGTSPTPYLSARRAHGRPTRTLTAFLTDTTTTQDKPKQH